MDRRLASRSTTSAPLESPEQKAEASHEPVRQLHARFHKEAARILDLALSGKFEEAEEAVALESEFLKLSRELTRNMMDWAKAHEDD